MTTEQAIKKAEYRLSLCEYHAEVDYNKGLAEAYRREAEWLSVVLRLAKQAAQAVDGERDG